MEAVPTQPVVPVLLTELLQRDGKSLQKTEAKNHPDKGSITLRGFSHNLILAQRIEVALQVFKEAPNVATVLENQMFNEVLHICDFPKAPTCHMQIINNFYPPPEVKP